jgi:hypothetical protein
MKTHRQRASDSAKDHAKPSGRRTEGGRRGSERDRPSGGDPRRRSSQAADLPPNENIRKHADEIYGDTEIPQRKRG